MISCQFIHRKKFIDSSMYRENVGWNETDSRKVIISTLSEKNRTSN